jgi:hypothetical protein
MFGERRFLGGMNLARPFGRANRVNATVPLAIMTIGAGQLSIGPIAALSRILPSVTVARPEVEAVFRSTGLLTPGVGLKEPTGVHFFWTFRGRRIVAELEALGYPVTPTRRPSLRLLSGRSQETIQ